MVRMLAAAVLGAALLVWLVVGSLTDRNVQNAVARDGLDKALHWGVYIASHIPDIETIFATGMTTQAQRDAIVGMREMGDVFRFALYNTDGRIVVLSDEDFDMSHMGVGARIDPEPMHVLTTGSPIVEVFDGSDTPERPTVFAEAYVPVINVYGQTIGIAHVYVDATRTVAYFSDSFESFGLLVSVLSAVLFMVPAAGFGFQKIRAERSRSEAEYLSKFDALTGLLNRNEFTQRCNAALEECRLGAVLFLDVDNFKSINDTYGHAIGDAYLEQIAKCLSGDAQTGDFVARFGGDEFVMAIRDRDQSAVSCRVRRILESCAAPLCVGESKIAGSTSIGIAMVPEGGTLEEAMLQADAALYHAKAAGRNQYALYGNDMGDAIRRRNRLERRLKDALKHEQFTIEYQPLVEGGNFDVIGYEALLRLKDIDGTPVSPMEFIPLAEEIGAIEEIGAWVLKEATRTVAQLPGTPKVAVNLSVAQFRSGKLCDTVLEVLAAAGLPANRLELEITESLLLDETSEIAHQIDRLQEIGVTIAMDDFGTGFSSLGYLWKYGFDRIKIDRSFVSGLDSDTERSLKIVETVILLGKRLGMQVTAEGVETQQQSDLLAELGCDVLQGFHFGRPSALIASAAHSPEARSSDPPAPLISVG